MLGADFELQTDFSDNTEALNSFLCLRFHDALYRYHRTCMWQKKLQVNSHKSLTPKLMVLKSGQRHPKSYSCRNGYLVPLEGGEISGQ